MSSIINDHENHHTSNKLLEYESIFKHYGFVTQSRGNHRDDERSIELNDNLDSDEKIHFKNLYETKRRVLERNESNKKTINANTITKKPKPTTAKNPPMKPKKSKKPEKKVCPEGQ